MMPIGEILKILGAATANEDPKDGHPQQQPLGVYAPLGAPASPAVPAGSQSDRDLQKAGLRDESSSDETRHQNGRTSGLMPVFQSALDGGACDSLWPLYT
jgi:hypothetical protein